MTALGRSFGLFVLVLLVSWGSVARAQQPPPQGSGQPPQSQSQPAAAQQTQGQPQQSAPSSAAGGAKSDANTPAPQAQPQMQVVEGAQQESMADSARRAKAQKAKAPKKVFTDEDMSRLSGRGVSVVGDGGTGSSEGGSNDGNAYAGQGDAGGSGGAQGNDNGERYWRGRARQIMDQIAATDQQIAKLRDDIAKSGPTGVDPNAGLAQNVIVIHDRNAQMKQLEERKANLEKQLDDLADEGRKAGADSSWFR